MNKYDYWVGEYVRESCSQLLKENNNNTPLKCYLEIGKWIKLNKATVKTFQ